MGVGGGGRNNSDSRITETIMCIHHTSSNDFGFNFGFRLDTKLIFMSGVICKMRVIKPSRYISKLLEYSPLGSITFALLVLILLSACAPVSPTAKEDRALFERLCKASDRNFVKFRPSVNGYAEGYEHSRMIGCPITSVPFKHLIAEGYQYYECFQTPWIERTKAPLETLHMRLRATTDDSCQHPRLANENRLVQREKQRIPI